MGGLTEPDLNEYYDTFAKFNTYINDIHKQSKLNQHHEGYLVNHKDYIELEKLVVKYYKEKQQEFRNNFYNRDETKWIDIIKVINKQKLIGNNFIHFIDLTLKNEVEKQQTLEKNLNEIEKKDNNETIQIFSFKYYFSLFGQFFSFSISFIIQIFSFKYFYIII